MLLTQQLSALKEEHNQLAEKESASISQGALQIKTPQKGQNISSIVFEDSGEVIELKDMLAKEKEKVSSLSGQVDSLRAQVENTRSASAVAMSVRNLQL